MSGSAATILIVDDEQQNCKLLESLLLPEGYITLSAASGEEALAAVAHHAPDLILLDIMMPDMDGYQVARTLKASNATSNIPIIMVTALNDRAARITGLDAGAEEFLTKPVDRAELWLRVRNLLRLKEFSDFLKNHSAILEQQVQERTAELQRFRSAMDATADAIFLVNRGTMRFIEINAAACKMLGYTRAEFFQMSPAQIAAVADEQMENAYDSIIAGESPNTLTETQFRRKDASQLQVEVQRHAHRSGEDWIIVGVVRDITERKKADQNFKALLEATPDAMVIVNRDDKIVLVNSRADQLFGWRREDLLGQNIEILLPTRLRGKHPESRSGIFSDARAGTLGTRLEMHGLRRDGSEFPMEVSLSPLDTEVDTLLMAAFRDITDRHAQEIKISRLSRIQAVLSGINAAIVRIRDRQELFKQACRIIVEHGRFALGWIAVLDQVSGNVIAVAQAGLPGDSAAGSALFNGSAGLKPARTAAIALREKQPSFDNHIEDAPGLLDANDEPDTSRVRRAAITLGAKSVIVLPLIVEGKTFGMLTLYAPERDFFDDEETALLNDLAGDISFSLEFIARDEKVDYLAYYDVLTGLANRSLFLERVAQYMRSAASGGFKLALFLFDLERFKNINDSLGRQSGDALLKLVAEWLTNNLGDANLFARVDADHFAIVLPEVRQDGDVARLVEKIMAVFLEHPFRLENSVFRIAAKVGVALYPDNGGDADTLFKNAEAALKNAKASGDRYLFYTETMNQRVAEMLTLENQLRQALDREEFVLHYQPKVNLISGKLTSAEALIRWNDPRTGLVPPARFIPILEETGLINDVGRWALRKAADDYRRWRAAGHAAVRISVNVSPLQLRNRGFITEIRQVVSIDQHAAAGLELEITESLIMEDVKHSIESLQEIRAMGVTVAIDDFGTGFSSLSYLSKLPVDTLKIDRSFVVDMTAGPEGLALVSTIINLAHALKLSVVAEGVETEEQSRLLRLVNCDEMQGFLFSKPVPGEVFETKFLASP